MVEIYIPTVEQIATGKELIILLLVLDLNHLHEECGDLRSKNICTFLHEISRRFVKIEI